MLADRIAPPGKYRVLGVDKFANEHWIKGDYDTRAEAEAVAVTETAEAAPHASDKSIATVYYVYDDTGKYLGP
jgi:hypothetical protein